MRTDIDISPKELTILKTLAQRATPGPWELTGIPGVTDILTTNTRNVIGSPHRLLDAAYIAAAHPAVILALLSRIEDLEKIVAGSLYGLYAEAHARAERLEKEADWLAREVSSWEHDQLDGTSKHIREVPELREAARKAVEGQCKK